MKTKSRVSTLRNLAGLSQQDVSVAMSAAGHHAWRNRQIPSAVERNARHLRLDEAVTLAGVLGVTLNQLAGLDPVEI